VPHRPATPGKLSLHSALGDLADPSHFDNWRPTLPIRKTRGFVLVRVHAPKLFAVGIKDGHQIMMMLTTPIFFEIGLRLIRCFFRRGLRHADVHVLRVVERLSQEKRNSASTNPQSNVHSIITTARNKHRLTRPRSLNLTIRQHIAPPLSPLPVKKMGEVPATAIQTCPKIVAGHETFADFLRLYR